MSFDRRGLQSPWWPPDCFAVVLGDQKFCLCEGRGEERETGRRIGLLESTPSKLS